jgi:hypothetical protein
MQKFTYQNFDLHIERLGSGSEYRASADSQAGVAKSTFTLSFLEGELGKFSLPAGESQKDVDRTAPPDMETARKLGGQLYDTIFYGKLRDVFNNALQDARHKKEGVRIRLRLDAPELNGIPWEYLQREGSFFSLYRDTPILRHPDLAKPIEPLIVQLPFRVLVVIAEPRDKPPIDAENEWLAMEKALSGSNLREGVELVKLDQATPLALKEELGQHQYHILHFIGHGSFDPSSQDGKLYLVNEKGLSQPVNGQWLGTLLHDHPSMRLAILNACQGAQSSEGNPFAGVAQSLIQQGIPAVLAMQYKISNQAAAGLSRAFYSALAGGMPVEAALASARIAIFPPDGQSTEWGTPVLYLRAQDGVLFNFTQKRQSPGRFRLLAVELLAILFTIMVVSGLVWDRIWGGPGATPTPSSPTTEGARPTSIWETPVPVLPDSVFMLVSDPIARCRGNLAEDLSSTLAGIDLGGQAATIQRTEARGDTIREYATKVGAIAAVWGECPNEQSWDVTFAFTAPSPYPVSLLQEPGELRFRAESIPAQRFIRSAALYALGQYARANDELGPVEEEGYARELTPGDRAGFYWLKGNSLLRLDEWPAALAAYTRALENPADDLPLRANLLGNRGLARLYQALGKPGSDRSPCIFDGREDLLEALALAPNRADLHVILGMILLECSREDPDIEVGAKEQADLALALESRSAPAFALKARVGEINRAAEILGDPFQIQADACTALAIDPTLAEAHRVLASIYSRYSLPGPAGEQSQAYYRLATLAWQREEAMRIWEQSSLGEETAPEGLGECGP